MVLGYMFRHHVETEFDKHNTRKTRITVWAIYLVLVFVPFFGKLKMQLIMSILYQYLTSIVGIAVLIWTAKTIKANKYINYVGQNTLIYFALHGKAYSVIQTLLKKFAAEFYTMVLSNVVVSSVFCLGFSLVLSVVLMIPAYIINRWFPFIIGRKNTRIEKRQ